MFIDGSIREGSRRLTIRNPYSGSVVGSAAKDSPEDVAAAIASVKTYAYSLPAERRSQLLRSAAEELLRRKDDFARRITEEAGTCLKESGREVERAYGNLVVASE